MRRPWGRATAANWVAARHWMEMQKKLTWSYVSRSSCTEYYFFRQTWANVSNNKVEYSEEKEEKSHSPFRNVLCLSQWLNPSPSAVNPVSQCIKRRIPVPILHLHSGGSRGGTLGSGPPPLIFRPKWGRPPYLRVWRTAPPLSEGLYLPLPQDHV